MGAQKGIHCEISGIGEAALFRENGEKSPIIGAEVDLS
jgi:hypothetical protein